MKLEEKLKIVDSMTIGETIEFKIGPCMKPITRLQNNMWLIIVKTKRKHEQTPVDRMTLEMILAHVIPLIHLTWEEVIEPN